MVLAAGLGKRMGSLTEKIPKPMIEIAGRALIDRAIDQLEIAGVTKVVVNTCYKADMLEAYLRRRTSLQILFSREEERLETGGGIANALHHFGNEAFFSVNSDVIWFEQDAPALKLLAQNWDDGLDALLLLHPTKNAVGYEGKGDFFADEAGSLIRRDPEGTAPYIYTGLQILHPRIFAGCPTGAFSLNLLYDKAIHASPPRLKAVIHTGELLNVGDEKGKALAEEHITVREDI